jgi:hypothetical protein
MKSSVLANAGITRPLALILVLTVTPSFSSLLAELLVRPQSRAIGTTFVQQRLLAPAQIVQMLPEHGQSVGVRPAADQRFLSPEIADEKCSSLRS